MSTSVSDVSETAEDTVRKESEDEPTQESDASSVDNTQDDSSSNVKEKKSKLLSESSKWFTRDDREPEDVYGTVYKPTILSKKSFGDVELIEFDNSEINNAPIIFSFLSVGVVSVLTGKTLIDHLELTLIGVVRIPESLQTAAVFKEQPSHAFRVYGSEKLIVFLCENGISDNTVCDVTEMLYEFAHRHRSPMIYVIDGLTKTEKVELPGGEEVEVSLSTAEEDGNGEEPIPSVLDDSTLTKLVMRKKEREKENGGGKDEENEEEREKGNGKNGKKKKRNHSRAVEKKKGEDKEVEAVAEEMFGQQIHYLSTSEVTAKSLRKQEFVPIIDGLITGVAGALVSECIFSDVDLTLILSPTSALYRDPASAVGVIEALDDLLPDLDLKKSAKKLEKEGAQLKKILNAAMQGVLSPKNVPQGMYN